MSEAMIYFIGSLYFYFISKWWQYLQIPNMIICISGAICLWFIPESPRFYVSKNKFDKAREAFAVIARVNRIDVNIVKEFVFEEEVDN